MKHKSYRITFLSVLLITVFLPQAFCNDSTVNFSFAPEVGFINGKIIENVWNVDVTETNKLITYTPTTLMSRLDWQMENSFYFGFDSNMLINNKLNLLFTLKNAISNDCGVMEDYDWLNPVTDGWKDDPADELTNYSIHINHLNEIFKLGFCAGWSFYLTQSGAISLTPRFGFELENISFCGIDGWGTYKKDNWQKSEFSGKVISYSQWYFAPILALNADFNISKHFETALDLSLLWIKDLDCIDFHYKRSKLFNDRIENAWKFNAELAAFYKINEMHKLGLKGYLSWMPDAYGFTYNSRTGTMPDSSTMGGTSRLFWSYGFVYVIRF